MFEDALNDELIDVNPFDRIALNKLLKQTAKSSDYEVDPFTAAERDALLAKARADERPVLQFWFNSCLRPGELMAQQWPKIDWIGRKARIDENLVAGVVKGPKTDAGVRAHQVRHTYASTLLTAGTSPWYVAQQLGHVDVQMVPRSTASSSARTTSGRRRRSRTPCARKAVPTAISCANFCANRTPTNASFRRFDEPHASGPSLAWVVDSGGAGGNRTPVRKPSPDRPTCLAD